MCNCIKEIEQSMKDHGYNGSFIAAYDFVSMNNKTYSEFVYKEPHGKRTRQKSMKILHDYCPFCGKKYDEKLHSKEGALYGRLPIKSGTA